MSDDRSMLGLVLTGGGARTAYQVGVLSALARWLPRGTPLPFPVVCGTSAGAINAAVLASHASDFRKGAARLTSVWGHFTTAQILRSDRPFLARASLRWLVTLAAGGLGRYNPQALLDVSPLRALLEARLELPGVARAIASGHLRALAITALGYSCGRSVTFYEGQEGLAPWVRARHAGRPTRVAVEHLLASAAIPFLFPAIGIEGEYFGDGSMRQTTPISPAIHLGADRLLIVDIRQTQSASPEPGYPSFARIGGHVLNSIFLDNLDADLERLYRVNQAVERIPSASRPKLGLRYVDACVVAPTANLSALAFSHRRTLPQSLRRLLGRLGALSEGGADLMSYLLFEKTYCRALIALGREDATARRDELLAFMHSPAQAQQGLSAGS